MEIKDRVYGAEQINKPVLIDLINSKFIQRLKGVFQLGMPPEYYHRKGFTRYEHSVGVWILLKRLGAKLKQQISGLLHDGSHTAFSHVIDWVVGDPTKEDYQDQIHLKAIKNSDVPKILSKYGLDYKEISKIENFSLLEKEAPDLCADRIDYTLRELQIEGKSISKLLFDLTVKDNEIVFKNRGSAEFFGNEYMRLQNEHWAGNEARARYYILANVLREAMQKKIISLEDLVNGQDYEIMRLLEKKGNREILRGLNLLKNNLELEETSDERGIVLEKKFRYVDPKILINGNLKRLSDISLEYRTLLDSEKQNSKSYKRILIEK